MPRSITGIYTLPQPAFVAGTTILSASVNSDLSDIATTLTQSLATTGVSSMTGPIKAFAGAVNSPSYTFAGDIDTGFYLGSVGVTTYTAGGVDIFDFSSTGLTLLQGEFIDSDGQIVRPLPIGVCLDWPANLAAPNGYILAAGTLELIATYPALFAVYSTLYGGDGVTTFGIPDYRGRVLVGRDNMGGSAANRVTFAGSGIAGTTIASAGGAQNYTLAQGNLPSVNWTVTDPTHNHTGSVADLVGDGGGGGAFSGAGAFKTETASLSINNRATGISVASGGSGTAVITMQPSAIVNKIIYHGVFV